jgi:hypothetical protein
MKVIGNKDARLKTNTYFYVLIYETKIRIYL